ncbi:pentatricopeptide repeat-containing protein At4g02750-like [Selaginella moellendorffii]|uniref:pentatricopeptide repeat-containing protein At4g02750-like n=1 Tax=Selaginella moellendorffii TaxID=88036 RepID=UPI000D1C2C39|nr:pentatricopeptide repeat-containing protein At4g02750-like [Selaginella moellendorffii]|eukprot:XP_024543358.1 pentatricopeptide repeat-containing protein At4g02750-like [Selaginella moellendorffii]
MNLAPVVFHSKDQSTTASLNKQIEMYGRYGDLAHARQIFHAIAHKDDFSWVMMLHALSRNGCVIDAKNLFDSIPEENCTIVAWNSMLSTYAHNGHLDQGKALFDHMPAWDIISWNTILSLFSKIEECFDKAKKCFDEMGERDLVSWTAILNANAKHGHLKDTEKLFFQMPQRNLVSWTVMLVAYSENGLVSSAKNFFDRMPQHDEIAWSALVSAYARAGDFVRTKNSLDAMPCVTTTALNAILSSGSLELARSLFESMPGWDLASLNAMLAALAHAGAIDEAQSFFSRMPQINLVSCTILIASFAEIGDLDRAAWIFNDRMPRHDTIAWNTMLSAFALNGYMEEAKEMFDRCPYARDLFSYNTVLAGIATDIVLCEIFFSRMPRCDLVSWNTLLSAYAESGHLGSCQSAFEAMPEKDQVSWNTMLGAILQIGDLKISKSFFFQMPLKNTFSWNSLISAFALNGDLERARTLFDQMPLGSDQASLSGYLAGTARSKLFNPSTFEIFHSVALAHGEINEDSSHFFESALIACSRSGKISTARRWFLSMIVDHGTRPCKHHYCCMVDLLARSQCLASLAENLVLNMPFQPDCMEWTCLHGVDVHKKESGSVALYKFLAEGLRHQQSFLREFLSAAVTMHFNYLIIPLPILALLVIVVGICCYCLGRRQY